MKHTTPNTDDRGSRRSVALASVAAAAFALAALAVPTIFAPAAGASSLPGGSNADTSSPNTSWSMSGQRGGTVAGGKKYSFSRLTVTGNDESLNFQVSSGKNSFTAAIAPANGATFANTSSARTFAGAETVATPSSPELNVSGDGAGCGETLGQFTIYEATFDSSSGDLTSMSMTFDQHCDGQIPALLGSITYDSGSAPHSVPSPGHGPAVTHVTASVRDDQLTVKWRNPSHNFGGTAVIVRRDKAAAKSPLGFKAVCDATGDTNICRVPGLAAGAWYSAAVYELDASGDPSKASSVDTDAAGMSVVAHPAVGTAQDATVIEGHLFGLHGGGIGPGPVDVLGREVGASGWAYVGRGRADSSGLVRATVRPDSNTYYRFAFLGKGPDGAALSPPVLVTVRPVITISITKTEIASGGTSYIQGTVTANAPVTLQLQEEWQGTWRNLSQETIDGGDVSYWFEIIGHSPGTAQFKIEIPGSQYFVSTVSGTVHCTVT